MTEPGGPSGPGGPDRTDELPRWQPFADAPSESPRVPGSPPEAPPSAEPPTALPDESLLTPEPDRDEGTIVPDQLHDAPAYVPPPIGMTMGGVMPPPDPADVPTSAWITTMPAAASPRRGLVGGGALGIVGLVVGIILVAAVAAGALGLLPSDRGKVLFGTAPGENLCSVTDPTNTVTTADPIFFAAVLKHHMDGAQAITFHITMNGVDFVRHEEPADGSAFDCYGNRESLGTLEAGHYVFEVIHDGDIEATGTLDVR